MKKRKATSQQVVVEFCCPSRCISPWNHEVQQNLEFRCRIYKDLISIILEYSHPSLTFKEMVERFMRYDWWLSCFSLKIYRKITFPKDWQAVWISYDIYKFPKGGLEGDWRNSKLLGLHLFYAIKYTQLPEMQLLVSSFLDSLHYRKMSGMMGKNFGFKEIQFFLLIVESYEEGIEKDRWMCFVMWALFSFAYRKHFPRNSINWMQWWQPALTAVRPYSIYSAFLTQESEDSNMPGVSCSQSLRSLLITERHAGEDCDPSWVNFLPSVSLYLFIKCRLDVMKEYKKELEDLKKFELYGAKNELK